MPLTSMPPNEQFAKVPSTTLVNRASRPIRGVYWQDEIVDIVDEPMLRWVPSTRTIVDSYGDDIGSVTENRSAFGSWSFYPELNVYDRRHTLVAVISRQFGHIIVKQPGYDGNNDRVFKTLGTITGGRRGYELMTHERDSIQVCRYVYAKFGEFVDRAVFDDSGETVAQIDPTMVTIDPSVVDVAQRAVIVAMAVCQWHD
ncbi:hypothetical protein DICA3_C16182 [Diutina catenulata]